MGFALPALALAGAATSAVGTISSGISASNQASYQATVAQNNATIANQNAAYASAAGEQRAQTESMKGAEKSAKVKSGQAANGIDVNTGSAVDVQASQRGTDEFDSQNVLQDAELNAYGYRTQATSFQAESALDKEKADTAVPGALLSAGGGLLSNASSIGGKWTTGSFGTT